MIILSETDATAFVGIITASVSHELQNVFAVINESGGLMQDIISFQSDPGPGIMKAPLLQIQNSIEKGAEIVRELNSFSHIAQSPFSSFDVTEAVSGIVFLSRRLFERKGLILSIDKEGSENSIASNQLIFQMVVFMAIEFAGTCQEHSEVAVSVKGEKKISVKVERTGYNTTSAETKSELEQALGELSTGIGAVIQCQGDSGIVELNF